jgi:hypothetical protein
MPAKCRVKFSNLSTQRGCIDKLDLKNDGCSTLGDGPALRAKVEVHVRDVLDRLVPGGGSPRSRCAAEKVKCFYKFDACLLGRLAKGPGFSATCPDYAPCAKYLTGTKSCFEKIENRLLPSTVHECFVYDDQAVLKDFDDHFVNDLIHSVSRGGKDLRSRRCTNDTSTACANDAPCVGGGGTCRFFSSGPLAVALARLDLRDEPVEQPSWHARHREQHHGGLKRRCCARLAVCSSRGHVDL